MERLKKVIMTDNPCIDVILYVITLKLTKNVKANVE